MHTLYAMLVAMFASKPLTAKARRNSHLVVVWHGRANEVWVGRGSAALATDDALAKAKADAHDGCEMMYQGANTTLVA
jgi:hypothetical protein